MKAEILSIGTELLLGDIVNTNAQYIAKELANLGIFVYHQSVVGDNPERVKEAYGLAFQRADLVITTGGLGPTKDDLTKEMAAQYFNKELVLHEESLHRIKEIFEKRNLPVNKENEKQAYFPEGAIVLTNDNGTAPGCIMNEGGKILILLPGPPREMIPMFQGQIVPYLQQFTDTVLVSKVLHIAGIGEGHMEEKIRDIVEGQSNPTVAPYAKEKGLTLRITASAKTEEEGEGLIAPVLAQVQERLGDHIYGEGDTDLESVVAAMLMQKKLTLSIAESCTGGLLTGRLVNYPGISAVLMEGVVTYSNESKVRSLGVKEETLKQYGAVSEETAREMAEGIVRKTGTDIGVSITGIAGPGGGTPEKPVGLVYIGLSIKGVTKVKGVYLWGDRQRVRKLATTQALDWLRRELLYMDRTQ